MEAKLLSRNKNRAGDTKNIRATEKQEKATLHDCSNPPTLGTCLDTFRLLLLLLPPSLSLSPFDLPTQKYVINEERNEYLSIFLMMQNQVLLPPWFDRNLLTHCFVHCHYSFPSSENFETHPSARL